MKKFMDKDFLLNSDTQSKLFHDFAENKPIFDWHCHLTAKEIYENKAPNNIYDLWLTGDHYKWRAMRSCGIDEKYITGDAEPFEKFKAFAKTLTLAIGNPLFHWSHLELQRYFDIDTVLCEDTAKRIWDEAENKIASGGFTPQEIIKKSNVFALCTTDDPCDSLEYHQKLKDSDFDVMVLPAFRPDKVINIETIDFAAYLEALENAADMKIETYSDMKDALKQRMDFFKEMGCAASDQSMAFIPYAPATDAELEEIFRKAKNGKTLTTHELEQYKFETLVFFGREYARRGFAMELHLGAMRNNSTRMFNAIGADTGFDSIDDPQVAYGLSRFLDTLDKDNLLPKTILFNLNPKDNYVLGTMLGNFQSAEAKSKIQFGSAWWFNDNIDGMTTQLKTLANLGVLGAFVGMVTDSRSFLSYPRHEYFRRILCSLIGSWVDGGLYPYDEKALEKIVGGISFDNSKSYFLG
ncbi:MAG: glucuronate isomerase [Faecalibacterium sp.]|nr:glucuronate isomerase [Ruminococcus sp.]MCM1392056.1 glucuronate isomerase [Ruminococcus sp.]MCM1485833.1 glucuronate isomerase [Faecalibacterium sp.]